MTTLGKYELLEELGEGATSEVYRARDTALGREVALKALKPSLVTDASAFERFAREAQAAAGLFHPNIATVLDMGEADGRFFIAMRYFHGKSLDKVLRENGPLSWNETLRMVAQIGSALDHAHQQGFLHRDVKPGNIIRAENGDFILTDFGLTRAMMSTGLTSHTGSVLGTPAYIAPEIWNGEQATPATDQYALACVVYECLTGQILFTGDTPPAVMKKIFDGPRLPSSWASGVPQGVGKVLADALNEQPFRRYGSLSAFVVALELIPALQNYRQTDSHVYQQEQKDNAAKGKPVNPSNDAPKKTKQSQTTSSQAAQPDNSGRQQTKNTTQKTSNTNKHANSDKPTAHVRRKSLNMMFEPKGVASWNTLLLMSLSWGVGFPSGWLLGLAFGEAFAAPLAGAIAGLLMAAILWRERIVLRKISALGIIFGWVLGGIFLSVGSYLGFLSGVISAIVLSLVLYKEKAIKNWLSFAFISLGWVAASGIAIFIIQMLSPSSEIFAVFIGLTSGGLFGSWIMLNRIVHDLSKIFRKFMK